MNPTKHACLAVTTLVVVASGVGLCGDAAAWGGKWHNGKCTHHRHGAGDREMTLTLGAQRLVLDNDNLDERGMAQLGGATAAWRWQVRRRSALEVSLLGSVRRSDDQRVEERRGHVGIAWLRTFWWTSRHRIFVVVGWQGGGTERDIDEDTVRFLESAWSAGFGHEWHFGRRWLITADLRGLYLRTKKRNLDDVSEERSYDGAWLRVPERRLGMSARIAAGIRF